MKTRAFLIVILFCPSCQQLSRYSGPAVRFSVSFNEVSVGVTLLGKPKEVVIQMPPVSESPDPVK